MMNYDDAQRLGQEFHNYGCSTYTSGKQNEKEKRKSRLNWSESQQPGGSSPPTSYDGKPTIRKEDNIGRR